MFICAVAFAIVVVAVIAMFAVDCVVFLCWFTPSYRSRCLAFTPSPFRFGVAASALGIVADRSARACAAHTRCARRRATGAKAAAARHLGNGLLDRATTADRGFTFESQLI